MDPIPTEPQNHVPEPNQEPMPFGVSRTRDIATSEIAVTRNAILVA